MGSVDLGIVGLDNVDLVTGLSLVEDIALVLLSFSDDEDPAHKPEPCRGHRPRTPLVL